MIIAIDGYEANVEKRVGIGRYAFEMLQNLYELGKKEAGSKEKLQFRVYLPGKPRIDMPKETYWWQYRTVWPRRLWTFFGLPLWLFFDNPRADVVFSPTHYIPRFIHIPRVMSIMDLSYLHFPQLFRKKDLHQLIHWTGYSIKNAEAVCTISEFSKHAIIETYRLSGKQVNVTYPGLSMDTTHLDKDIYKKYKIKPSYILSVGTLQPRKNFSLLIEAFAKYCKTTKNSTTDLVIVGKKGWLYEEILKAPKQFGIEDRVKFLSFVPDADLPSLYKGAECFCLPSLYEGFGLPVLEAMAAGTQVVVSNSSSLPEIAGKAGIYIDSSDIDSIRKGIETAIKEKNIAKGKERIRLGIEQAKKFTWEEAARKTLEVLKEVGGKSI